MLRWGLTGVLVLIGGSWATADGDSDWKVGRAATKVTPNEPIRLAGYASRTKPFERVEADIYVKALALEDAQGHRAVILTSDQIGFRAECAQLVWKKIKENTGLDPRQVLLSCSHTHTGPLMGLHADRGTSSLTPAQAEATVRYTRWFVDQAVATVGQSLEQLQPAHLTYGWGVAGFVMNRREVTESGVRLGVNPSGFVDRRVPILHVTSVTGKTLAVVFGAACHNTTLTGRHFVISGDYAGFAQQEIERQLPGAQAMFMIGCAASANPYPRGTLDDVHQHGLELGVEVCRVLKTKLAPISGPLRTVMQEVELPLQEALSSEQQLQWTKRGGWRKWVAETEQAWKQNHGQVPGSYRCPIAVWQFGADLTLVGLSGEVVGGYVPLLRKRLGARQLWLAGYCNDVWGYLPTRQVLDEGGYETRGVIHGGVGILRPEGQKIVVDAVDALAEQVGRPRGP